MATRMVQIFEEQTGITGTSDYFLIDPAAQVSLMAREAASGTAKIQVTLDPHVAIEADTAHWTSTPSGDMTDTFMETTAGPITGARLVAASGTWIFKVLQVKDTDKEA